MGKADQTAEMNAVQTAMVSIVPIGIAWSVTNEPSVSGTSTSELDYQESINSPKRFLQFSLGRAAARLALEKLSVPELTPALIALPRLTSGMVGWPPGIIGSISHSNELGLAIVGRQSQFSSLGVDLEFHREVSSKVMDRICTPTEREKLINLVGTPLDAFFAIFSAKESAFKALFPIVGKYFGFQSISLFSVSPAEIIDSTNPVLELSFRIEEELSNQYPKGAMLKLQLISHAKFSLTLCALPSL